MSLTEISPAISLLLVLGVLYLDGLAFIGFVCTVWTIRSVGKQKKWKKWLVSTLVTFHFVLGIWPILTPTILIHNIQSASKTEPPVMAIILLGIIMVSGIIIVLWKCSSFFPETGANIKSQEIGKNPD